MQKQQRPYSLMSSQRWPLAKSWIRLMKQLVSCVPGFRPRVVELFRTRNAILMLSGSMRMSEESGPLSTWSE